MGVGSTVAAVDVRERGRADSGRWTCRSPAADTWGTLQCGVLARARRGACIVVHHYRSSRAAELLRDTATPSLVDGFRETEGGGRGTSARGVWCSASCACVHGGLVLVIVTHLPRGRRCVWQCVVQVIGAWQAITGASCRKQDGADRVTRGCTHPRMQRQLVDCHVLRLCGATLADDAAGC